MSDTDEFERPPIFKLGDYVRAHTQPCPPDEEGAISVHFFSAKAVQEPSLDEFLRLIRAVENGEGEFGVVLTEEDLAGGPSYITLGAWLGSQDIALRFQALGDALGLWRVITPAVLRVSGADADDLAGRGFVMTSGFFTDGSAPAIEMPDEPSPEPLDEVDTALLTESQREARAQARADGHYSIEIIEKAEPFADVAEDGTRGYSITFVGGMGCGIDVPPGIDPPEFADTVVLYSKSPGVGGFIEGYDLRDVALKFRTEEEIEAERQAMLSKHEQEKTERWEASKDELLAQYEQLPEGLRKRIDRFVANCPTDWWVNFGAYEVMALNDAVKLYEAAKDSDDPAGAIAYFYDLPWEEQKALVDISDGHSGNSFGYVCQVASQLAIEDDEVRARVLEWGHGALVYLTGCEEYGCTLPPKGVFPDDPEDDPEPESDEDPAVDREPVEAS